MRFEDFAEARLPALLRYATLLAGGPHDGRDLVQEVLAKALVRWHRVGATDEPYHYVHRMLTNEFLSQRRRRRVRTVPLTHDALDGPRAPQSGPAPTGDGGALWDLLATLPPQQRAVLVLRYYEGLGDDEIADVLGCRPGTVRGYASRALATLRIHLTDDAAREGALP